MEQRTATEEMEGPIFRNRGDGTVLTRLSLDVDDHDNDDVDVTEWVNSDDCELNYTDNGIVGMIMGSEDADLSDTDKEGNAADRNRVYSRGGI